MSRRRSLADRVLVIENGQISLDLTELISRARENVVLPEIAEAMEGAHSAMTFSQFTELATMAKRDKRIK